MRKNINKRAVDIEKNVENSLINAGDNNVYTIVYNLMSERTDTKLSEGKIRLITLLSITAISVAVTAIFLAIVLFVYFPAETKARMTFPQFIVTFLAVSAVCICFIFVLLKAYQNLKILIIILIPFCMAFSVASAAYLLDENVLTIIGRIIFSDDSCLSDPDFSTPPPCGRTYSEIKVGKPETKPADIKRQEEVRQATTDFNDLHKDQDMSAMPKPSSAIQNKMTGSVKNSIGMEFVYIPPGRFTMGSPKDEPGRYDGETQHEVTLTEGFYMQTTEVTQEQWKALMGNNPSSFKDCGDNCPVETVSWNDIQDFIKKLNQKGEGVYRLPTEAEWEYAARAGTTTPFAFGKCLSTDQANYDGNFPLEGCPKGKYRGKTVPVGSFDPNAWGLYDMHGNVWEWCQDWYGNYPADAVTDPVGPSSGSLRVLRGGGWLNDAGGCRTANRNSNSPGNRSSINGFRLVRP